ncbi:MAG TPA: hypothetical protein VFA97_09360 [Gaiellaceae bacterium]|nr:hypothetical protein [Gaiellaceae bacterium]
MRRSHALRLVATLAGVAFAVVLWGGYDRRWRWTGFAHRALLWDWLHVLLLPLAVTVAPLWVRHRARLGALRRVVPGAACAAFVLLVVLAYSFDLSWTGFPGNTLWDWLELLVLPLAVALLPVWLDLSLGLRARHVVAAAWLLSALGVCAVGGYELGWSWTGFRGNTLFDWLQLFLAPILLPLVLIPLAATWMTPPVEPAEAEPPAAASEQDAPDLL